MTESHDVEKNFLKTYNLPLHVHCTAVIYLPKKNINSRICDIKI